MTAIVDPAAAHHANGLTPQAGQPPLPSGPEGDRWREVALRRRLLSGTHRADIIKAISDHVDPTRQRQWGVPDLSSNVLKSGVSQLAVLHDREPVWGNLQGEDRAKKLLGETGYLRRAGWAALMTRFSMQVIGLRECLMHVSVIAEEGTPAEEARLLFRPVYPDHVICEADPSDPERPVAIRELRLREDPKTHRCGWYWTVYDIRERGAERYAIHEALPDGELGPEVTSRFDDEGAKTGEAYPFRDSKGRAYLPYVLYHAARTGSQWDSYDLTEVVVGTIVAAVLMTFYVHCMRDASWPQRYAVGVRLMGAGTVSDDSKYAQQSVPTDPSSILIFQAVGEAQAIISQFEPGADPEKILGSIMAYTAQVMAFFGISPADIQRMNGDPRSGYAIAISNSGKREAQRRFAPQFRQGDTEVAALCAKLLNARFPELGLPEQDYTIEYQAIPLSDQELEARRRDILEQVEAGLMSKIDAYMELHPGVGYDGALRALVRVERDKLILSQEIALVTEELAPETETAPEPPPALNGAQVTAALEIVVKVANAEIPRQTGVEMLTQFFGIDPRVAEDMVGEAGKGFEPAAEEEPPATPSPAPVPGAPASPVDPPEPTEDPAHA